MALAHCPCCDIEEMSLSPLEAFALGIGIRPALDPDKTVAEQTCPAHRMRLVMAMMKVIEVANPHR